MNINDTIQQMADNAVAKLLAEYEARQTPAPDDPASQLARTEARLRFNELIMREALLHGVRAAAVRFVQLDAEAVFTLEDGALVPRHGQTDPSDPLSPLTPSRWLQDLAKTNGYLFAAEGPMH